MKGRIIDIMSECMSARTMRPLLGVVKLSPHNRIFERVTPNLEAFSASHLTIRNKQTYNINVRKALNGADGGGVL